MDHKKILFLLLALTLLFGIVFSLYPEIDLHIMHYIYSNHGSAFFSRQGGELWSVFPFPTSLIKQISILLFSIIGVVFIMNLLCKTTALKLNTKMLTFILLVLLLAPGLLVNTVLKEYWGRARPHDVIEFGGTKHFTPPLIPSAQCSHNCSFVSGHTSMATFFVVFSFLLTGWRQKIGYGSALTFAVFVSLSRVLKGSHFPSDVMFSMLFTLMIGHLLYLKLFEQKTPTPA